MVTGYEIFREAMQDHIDNFIVIGGTACEVCLADTGRTRHVTKDIDLIVIVDNITRDFLSDFWQFIHNGGYTIGKRENSVGKIVYALYRFNHPSQEGFPWQIELLASQAERLLEPQNIRIEPISANGGQYSLSSIVMDKDLYDFTIAHSEIREGMRMADEIALIALKMRAFLNLSKDKKEGKTVHSDDILKHRRDILNLMATGKAIGPVSVCHSIFGDAVEFVSEMRRIHQDSPQVLAQSMSVPPEAITEYLNLLDELFVLEK